jgi:TPP-dependent pyruvate/acetoin dehydrogenase alpha subunit
MTLPDKDLLEMYRLLVLTREFEESARAWKQRGDIFEIPHSSIGQEAIGIGACYGLRPDDWVMPSLRTRGAFFARGANLKDVVATMCAKKTGYSGGRETSHHAGIPEIGVLVGSGVVGASIAVAVGAALGLQYLGTDSVVVDFFGDGASNRGDFHEGLNLAGVQRLPIVFVCENNLYAMSVPHRNGTSVEDIVLRAPGYGMPGRAVDGNDVLTVHEAVQEAVSRARKREGPTLIECKTYRWRPHCEVPALENEPWRPQEEIDEWKGKDPVEQMKTLLLDRRVLSEDEDESIRARIRASLEEALEYAQGSPDPSPDEATQGIYDAESD